MKQSYCASKPTLANILEREQNKYRDKVDQKTVAGFSTRTHFVAMILFMAGGGLRSEVLHVVLSFYSVIECCVWDLSICTNEAQTRTLNICLVETSTSDLLWS